MNSYKKLEWAVIPISRLEAYRSEWNRLNTEGPNTPLLDIEFFRPMLEICSNPPKLLVVGKQSGECVAMGVFYRSKGFTWQTFQPPQAPMGMWLTNQEIPIPRLLESLQKNLPGFCLVLGITQQDPDVITRFHDSENFSTFDYIKTAKITVDKPFEDYWAQRSNNIRQNLRRQRNRLLREGVETHLKIVTEPTIVGSAIDNYGFLESRGWKGKQGTAVHPDNTQGWLYRRLLEYYCKLGEGVVYQYWYDNRLVASDIYLRRNGIIYLLKTTYDESQKSTSPTMLMREQIIKEIFQRKQYVTIEYFGRLMEWHTKWTKEIRTMFHINIFRWPILAKFHGSKWI